MLVAENHILVPQNEIIPKLQNIMHSHSISYENIFNDVYSDDVTQYQFMIAVLFTKLAHSAFFY
jgi:hypothetical protein